MMRNRTLDRHSARIMIVDRSEVAQSIIAHILQKEMQNVYIVTCGSAEEALEYIHREKFDLITTALLLPGLDGLDLCHEIRQSTQQQSTPVVIVSSDADSRLLREGFSAGVSDYFNKSLGYRALVEFIKEITQRQAGLVGRVLYVEDSLTTARVTYKLMQNHGFQVTHVTSAEQALNILKQDREKHNNETEYDVVFTDFFLKGAMSGGDLLHAIRTQLHCSRQELPVLVITVKNNESCQADIFHSGANDFIVKPTTDEVLISRLKSLLLIKQQYNVLQRYSRDMYQLATTDALTGVRNKEFLFHDGPEFLKKHANVCLMMVDIDKLEHINSSYGHIAGDHVLHMIGHYLNEYFSEKKSVIARFGGKKFTVLLSDCTKENAKDAADLLREKIMQLRPDDMEVTVSIGLAITSERKVSLNRLIMSADDALESAKQQGLNRVFTAKELS